MHPPLHRPHPDCQEFVKALERCHAEYKFGKFLGACNDAKRAMDQCFREEKIRKRTKNLENARARREKMDAFKRRN
jgi:COX assembly mitochondrial protein 2